MTVNQRRAFDLISDRFPVDDFGTFNARCHWPGLTVAHAPPAPRITPISIAAWARNPARHAFRNRATALEFEPWTSKPSTANAGRARYSLANPAPIPTQ